MTPQTLTLSLANVHTRLLVSRTVLVSLLGLSFAVGLSVAASNPGLIGAFLDILTISFLVLCPICAKGAGTRAVMTLGAITAIAATIGLLSKLTIGGGSSSWFGDAAWGSIQVALVGLATSTNKPNTNLSGVLRIASAR